MHELLPLVDSSDFVKIQIEQFTGEMMLEIELMVRASTIQARASGSNLTWTAHGVRVIVPSAALAALHDALERFVSVADAEKDQTPSPPKRVG